MCGQLALDAVLLCCAFLFVLCFTCIDKNETHGGHLMIPRWSKCLGHEQSQTKIALSFLAMEFLIVELRVGGQLARSRARLRTHH